MPSRGLEYAILSVRDFLQEDVGGGISRFDAEVDAIESDSPALTLPALPDVDEFLGFQSVTKKPFSIQVYGDERIERVDMSNGHSAARYRIGVVLLVHPNIVGSYTAERLAGAMVRLSMALRRCLQGASVSGAVTDRQAAQTLNKRVLLSMVEEFSYRNGRPVQSGRRAPQTPLDVRARLWVRPQASNQ